MLHVDATRAGLLLLVLSFASCTDDEDQLYQGPDGSTQVDAAARDAARPDAAPPTDIDAAADAGTPVLKSCLDSPNLATPPTGSLPCSLLPPGL